MPKKDIAAAIAVGAGLLAALVTRKSEADDTPVPVPDPGSPLHLRIIKVRGRRARIGHMGLGRRRGIRMGQGIALEEGSTYKVQATVTNASTRAGQPVANQLEIRLQGTAGAVNFMPLQVITESFGPGEARVLESAEFTIPVLTQDVAGNITGSLSGVGSSPFATAQVAVDLVLADIIPGGTISLDPPGGNGSGGSTAPATPTMLSPAPGSVLGSSPTFSWHPGTNALSHLELMIGPGFRTTTFPPVYSADRLSATVDLSASASFGAPAGTTIYVSLAWLVPDNNGWFYKDYTYIKG